MASLLLLLSELVRSQHSDPLLFTALSSSSSSSSTCAFSSSCYSSGASSSSSFGARKGVERNKHNDGSEEIIWMVENPQDSRVSVDLVWA